MEFSHVVEAAPTTNADLLVIVVLGDPNKDPLFRLVDTATQKGLSEAARSESFEGKPGQSLTLWTNGAITARRVMVIGAGAKAELEVASLRDVGAAAAQNANKVGAKRIALVPHPWWTHPSHHLTQPNRCAEFRAYSEPKLSAKISHGILLPDCIRLPTKTSSRHHSVQQMPSHSPTSFLRKLIPLTFALPA